MDQLAFDIINSATGPFSYLIVFGVLLACGLGFPLPEDVSLITGGYLVFRGQANLYGMLATGFLGILVGDTIVYSLGRLSRGRTQGAGGKLGKLLSSHLTPDRIAKVEAQFEKRGPAFVMIARFLPGVRAATYFVAGGARMSYLRFIAYDGLAALASAPIFVLLGWHFGAEIESIVRWAADAHLVLIGLLVAAGGFFAFRFWRKRKAEALARKELAEAPPVTPPQPPRAKDEARVESVKNAAP